MLVTCPHCGTRNRVDEARINAPPICGHCHRELLTGAPIALDESNFDLVVTASSRPVVIDFWASWCGPCLGFAPVFSQAAVQHPDVLFAKVDTDANPRIATRYAIRSIPTLALFAAGEPIERISGALPASQFETWLRAGVAKTKNQQ
ncbi:MAG: thioredoxin TrxC [Burkholderiaceae bacterium]